MRILQTIILRLALVYVHFASCKEKYTFCDTPACKSAANLLLDSIDTSVKPCDDIYQYVCGKWIRTHSNAKNSQKRETTQPDTKSIQQARLHAILNETSQSSDAEGIKLARQLYQKCLNTAKRDKDGLTFLVRHLKQVGEWPLLHPESKVSGEWQHIYKKIELYFTSASLYSLNVTEINVTYELLLTPPNTFLPYERDTAGRVDFRNDALNKYKNFIRDVSHELLRSKGLSFLRERLLREIGDIVEFEKKLLLAQNRPGRTVSSTVKDGSFTINEWQKMYNVVGTAGNGKIKWLDMIQNKFAQVKPAIQSNTKIVVLGSKYFSELGPVLEQTPLRTIVNYIVWHFIRSLLPYTTSRVQTLVQNAERIREKIDMKERKQVCVEMPNLIYAVDYEYVKRYFNKDSKKEVLRILSDVTHVTRKNVQKSTWMNTAMKRSFAMEIDSRVLQVGYPDWYSDAGIARYYQNLNKSAFNLTFLDNVLSVLKFDALQDNKKIGQQINPEEWHFTSFQYKYGSGWRSKSNATIPLRMPAGIFRDIVYHPDKPKAMNYAAVAYGLGYDLITGYGFLYDLIRQDINTTKALRPIRLAVYRRMKNCFKTYYDTYVQKVKTDKLVPFELFVVDTAVLFAAWQAWSEYACKRLTQNTKDVRLRKLPDHTTDQLFFISILYNLCDNTLISSKHLLLSNSFANLPDFRKAFACPKGSPMNPTKRCNVWS